MYLCYKFSDNADNNKKTDTFKEFKNAQFSYTYIDFVYNRYRILANNG